MNKESKLQIGAWALSTITVLAAFIAWGQNNEWKLLHISSYNLFPLFGLVAFSLMWSHYIVAVLRQHYNVDKSVTKKYFELTSHAVLLFIVLHPGLLIWQLFRDGFGLPPGSYLHNYIAPNSAWAALLGTVSFFIFIGYELRRKYGKKSWWKYMQYLSDLAMIAIFVHALRLGRELNPDWFRVIWYVYGVSLLFALGYIYKSKIKKVTNS